MDRVVEIDIYNTERDRQKQTELTELVKNTELFKCKRLHFCRPDISSILQKIRKTLYQHDTFDGIDSHARTLLLYCGGPNLGENLRQDTLTVSIEEATCGAGNHTYTFEQENYGHSGLKKNKNGVAPPKPRLSSCESVKVRPAEIVSEKTGVVYD